MSSTPSVDLRNSFIAGIYVVFGLIGSIILAFVILIHLKFSKFRHNIYSIIFACLFCEITIPLHYLLNGIRTLLNSELQEVDTLCILDATFLDFAVATLLAYNILTLLSLVFNILPSQIEHSKKSKIGISHYRQVSFWTKYAYVILHTVAIACGILHAILFYMTSSYGVTYFGDCFMPQEYSPYLFAIGSLLGTYCVLTLVYLFMNMKKMYYIRFPTLKSLPVYCFITSICWCWNFIRYFVKSEHIAGYNSSVLTAELISLVVIIYIRISNSYIQTILKQGDSSNRFFQAFLIFFCMDDNYVDLESYERRATIKLHALSGEFNINE